ncbi:MAG TPA: hypothetical protein VEL03_10800 [Streptosporangiaceae bacterium]|nr:hypothetical protein [Streptosporangiaceae bacterium]
MEPSATQARVTHQADPLAAATDRGGAAPEAREDSSAAGDRVPDHQSVPADDQRSADNQRSADDQPRAEAGRGADDQPRAGETGPTVPAATRQPGGSASTDEPIPSAHAERASALEDLREPELSAHAEHRNGAGGHSPEARSWRDPYAAPPAGDGHSHSDRDDHRDHRASAGHDLGPRPQPGGNPSVSRGAARRDASSGHVRPAGQPDRGLSGDQARLVAGMVAACRAAEGRNRFDEYGDSGLTPLMRRIAAQLPRGGLAPGSEADSLKSPHRMAAKLERLIARHPGRTAEELAAGIGDGVRYAFTFDPDYYAEGIWLVHRSLKIQGFELEARRNRWDSPEYKGVWTRWRDPAHDLSFEVQFHTAASWDVVRRTHGAYVQITDPATPAAERARLRARQVAAAAAAKAPPHWTEISDFGRRLGDT